MRSNHHHQHYTLWFVNQSLNGGQVCIYHDVGNISCNHADTQALAWRVEVANPRVDVCFQWNTDYNFIWFDGERTKTRQIIPATASSGSAVSLIRNSYGHDFQTSGESPVHGQLSIQTGASVLPQNSGRAGIGMDGAGTFVLPVRPNTNVIFSPVPDSRLAYWISFGAYALDINDPIDPATLNLPTKFSFPAYVSTLTAILNSQNEWTVHAGRPVGS